MRQFLPLLLALAAGPLAAQNPTLDLPGAADPVPDEAPASSQVSLELVLLADGSQSISPAERALQREGYADAITHPEVLSAIENSLTGAIAVIYVEWAVNQAVVADWTIIDGPEAAEAFSTAILSGPLATVGSNAIGAALLEGQRLIEDNDIDSLRQVIDFSSDSLFNMSGPPLPQSRQQVIDAGITINGLPIVLTEIPRVPDDRLARAFEIQIIGGPGAFVVTAHSRHILAEAIRRKLILEIAGLTPGESRFAQAVAPAAP